MSQQQANGQGDDQEFLKMTVIALICGVIIFALIMTQTMRINAAIGAITWIHTWPFAAAGRALPFLQDIPLIGNWIFGISVQAHEFLDKGGFAAMTPDQRWSCLTAGGRAASLIYGGFFFWVALNGRDFRVDQKFKTRHSLESMIWLQSEHWFTTRLARHVNPLSMPEISSRKIAENVAEIGKKAAKMPGYALPRRFVSLRPDTWNRALRPEEWLIANGLAFDPEGHARLIGGEGQAPDRAFEFKDEWEHIDLEALSEILSRQLRAEWKGPEALRPCHRAIYAVMALFFAYDVDGGNKLLNDLAIVSDGIKGRTGGMDDAIRAETGLMARIDDVAFGKKGKALAKAGEVHAWVETAFPTFLAIARKDRGVLPTAPFIWLKSEDRLMWYILNNVGNDAVMVEAAGALAHCKAEQQIKKRLRRPAVYQAARAMLEDYLDMTPERITARREKAEMYRAPGDQLDLIHASITSTGERTDIDGITG